MPSSHLILCCPLLLLPSIFSSIRVFSNESALCIRWPKYWSLSFSVSPSNERPGLISFRMDWLGLLAVQGTLKSLLQHLSSKASILWRSALFIVQLSHPHLPTGKTIALTRQIRNRKLDIHKLKSRNIFQDDIYFILWVSLENQSKTLTITSKFCFYCDSPYPIISYFHHIIILMALIMGLRWFDSCLIS